MEDGQIEEGMTGADDSMDTNQVVDDMATALGMVEEPAGEEIPAKVEEPPAAQAAPADVEKAVPVVEKDDSPGTWRPESKAKWAAIDPEVRAEVLKREADIARFVNESQPVLQTGKAVNDILAPYTSMFKQYNVQPVAHLKSLLEGHTAMVFGTPETKVTMLRQLAQNIGVDLKTLVDPNAEPAKVDPALSRVQQELAEIRNQTAQTTAAVNEAREAELASGIVAFAKDEVAHPHFWELADDMTALINSKSARSLEEAYEFAKMRNPVVRGKILELEATKLADARAVKERERVTAARKASSVNVKSRSGGRASSPGESIDDTLRDTMAAINSRTH